MDTLFEVNPSVIDANELLKRVRQNVLMVPENSDISQKDAGFAIDGTIDKIQLIQDNLDDMLTNIQTMKITWNHQKAPLGFRNRHLRPIVVFVKKVVRKLLFWMIKPYIEQQNAFNGAVTRAITSSLQAQQQLLKSLKDNSDN